jgi:hypothetical protein
MDAAHVAGTAVPFADTIPWLVRYDNSWWVVYDDGWLRITDTLTTADLDHRTTQTVNPQVSSPVIDLDGST